MIHRTLIGLAATGLLCACGSNDQPAPQQPEQVEQPDPRDIIEEAAKDGVRRILKDPASAEFEQVAVFEKQKLVCGRVNSKNSFGAYTGFEDFVIDGDTLYMASTHPRETQRELKKCSAVNLASMKADRMQIIARMEKLVAETKANKDFSPAVRDKLVRSQEKSLAGMKRSEGLGQ